jgi:hypothetical protein
MDFANRTFTIAGIYGIVVLAPLYFLENWLGENQPPAITHPEFFYGFVGIALVWQVAFIVIGRDPTRFRPLMVPCMLEKFSYSVAVFVLFLQSRIAVSTLAVGMVDFGLGCLFVASYWMTRSR